ncbi:MAG: hypothetical protein ABI471_11530 [Sphingomonas bacterium]
MRTPPTVDDCAAAGTHSVDICRDLAARPMARNRPVVTLAIIALVALIARAVTFGDPVVHVDESFYFGTAYGWLHGATPYLDIWDRKPIGLFILYLPAAMLGLTAGIWAYQLMALTSVIATAWLIARLAERAGWGKGALAGALAYVLWVNLADGQGGQAPIFYNLLVIGAAALIAPRPAPGLDWGTKSPVPGLAAMGLIGLALQIKYSVVFEGLFFGSWLLWCEWRAGRRGSIVPLGAALIAVALLPTAIAWFAWYRIGADEAWLYANLTSITARRSDPALEQFANLVKIALIVSPLISASILTWRSRSAAEPAERALRIWLFGWLGAAMFGLFIFGAYFEHYALPLLVPASICASGFFGDHRTGRRIVVPLLLIGFLGGQALLVVKRHNRGTAAQFAGVVDAIGHGSGQNQGCLFVFSGESLLYPASGRCALTRYHFSSHLGRLREEGAIGVDQRVEISRILALKPAIVVFRPPYPGERSELRDMAMSEMKRHYRLRATRQLGTRAIEIYTRAAP